MRLLFRRARTAAASLLLLTGLPAVLLAQQGGETGFVPAKPGDLVKENLPATPFVFAAYAVVWTVVVVYVITLWRRIAKAEQEIAEVAAKLEHK
jgi:CcmD family protein